MSDVWISTKGDAKYIEVMVIKKMIEEEEDESRCGVDSLSQRATKSRHHPSPWYQFCMRAASLPKPNPHP